MSPLEVLGWLGVIFAGLVVLSTVVVVAVVVVGATVGLRRMREDEDKPEVQIFKGRAEK